MEKQTRKTKRKEEKEQTLRASKYVLHESIRREQEKTINSTVTGNVHF